jgi:hypothetical protein
MRPDDPRVVNLAVALAAILSPHEPTRGADDLLPLPDAARIAATSVRVLRQAIARGDLPGFGRQRDRSVRRGDLLQWIEARRVRVEGVDDVDLQRRIRRLRAVRGSR